MILHKNRIITNNSEHIKKVFSEHICEFNRPGYINLADSNLDQPEKWENSKVKILLCHLMDAENKVAGDLGSIVENVLVGLLKQRMGDDVFVDIGYMCDRENIELFEKYQLPVWFGCVTHRSVLDFDAILITNSSSGEKINIPFLLHHSGIPVWLTQRLKPENENIPLIFLGGNASSTCDVLFGSSYDGKEQSLVDGVFVGYGEGVVEEIPGVILKTRGIPKQERLKEFLSFTNFIHPLAYEHQYKDSWRISSILKKIPEAPDTVKMNKQDNINDFLGSDRFVLHHGGQSRHLLANALVSWGCSSGGSCTFCQEGNISGGWREKNLDKIESELKKIKLSGMPDTINFLSFNISYYQEYLKLIELGSKYFGNIGSQAARVDMVAKNNDYLDLLKKLNFKRMTLGYEGVSNRIRNNYLNKWLSEEDFLTTWRAVLKNKLIEVKLYLIDTGLEHKEDYDELFSVIDKCYGIRNEEGVKTRIRAAFTNLCYYPNSPLAWEPRRSMVSSIGWWFPEIRKRGVEECDLTKEDRRYLIDGLYKRGVVIHISTKGHLSDFIQLTLDLGRKMTAILVDLSINKNMVYGHFSTIKKDDIFWTVEQLKLIGIDIIDVAKEKPYTHIFPDDYVHTVDREYLIRCHKAIKENKPTPFCLSTIARPYRDAVEEEVKSVNDITNLTDKPRNCAGCGYCKDFTPDEKEARQVRTNYSSRKYDTTTSVDSVLASIEQNKARERLFVSWYKKKEFSYFDPNTTWHYLWSQMMQEVSKRYSEDEAFKSKTIHEGPAHLISRDCISDASFGVHFNEVQLTSKFNFDVSELKDVFNSVKKNIKSSSFIDAKYVNFKSVFPKDSYQLIIFRSKNQNYALKDKILTFDNNVRIPLKLRLRNVKVDYLVKNIPNLPQIFYIEGNTKSGNYFVASIPAYVNPFMFINSITDESMRYIYSNYESQRILYYKQGMRSCSVCGSPSYINVFTQEDNSVCEKCYRKALTMKVSNILDSGNIV
jgi:radical SAM superfamily enzyme YgiQ (UPF0313 family)